MLPDLCFSKRLTDIYWIYKLVIHEISFCSKLTLVKGTPACVGGYVAKMRREEEEEEVVLVVVVVVEEEYMI
ncbi:hypothetical protein E2C01_000927 [Portunus trituberculatus]|uniref:Uncharacterized protein n=1 Tax=Portunus trituberculatus TaxID=210409 RepID=A0A5B7CL86_PORTR|nr:hypothetical protein [Portunus trituberculatus]